MRLKINSFHLIVKLYAFFFLLDLIMNYTYLIKHSMQGIAVVIIFFYEEIDLIKFVNTCNFR